MNDHAGYMLEEVKTKDAYDILYKVIVIGESDVGKTALVNIYRKPDQVLPNLTPTIGIDFRLVDILIDGVRVRVQLWDTAGQERFRTMTTNFFRGAKGILLLFDVSNRKSFITVENWVNSLKKNGLEKEEVFMIGNKIDLNEWREVNYEDGKTLAAGYGMKYFETSAKTGENVKKTVEKLIYNMKDRNHPFLHRTVHSICDTYICPKHEVGSTVKLGSEQRTTSRCCHW